MKEHCPRVYKIMVWALEINVGGGKNLATLEIYSSVQKRYEENPE